ncbi:MAG: hypothetical protein EXQ70_07205 [Solirubrobacterales bacterium]|nr:hypothetical protein [Solirubrobacterales bacterium]
MSPNRPQIALPRSRRGATWLGVLAALTAACGAILAGGASHATGAPSQPNIIFILTDDQTMSEMSSLQSTQSLIDGRGVNFKRAYINYPMCCPSRATIFSGQYMHNHLVRGNARPYGGWSAFQAHENDTLPVWLSNDGYYTAHIGKYLNGYAKTGAPHVPPGWDEWYAKVGTAENQYLNYTLYEKGPSGPPAEVFYADQDTGFPDPPPAPLETDYQTDVYGYKALDFLKRAEDSSVPQPFYLSLSFKAPHGPFQPAARDAYTLSGESLPKLPGFDEKDISDKPLWLRKQSGKRLSKGLKKSIAVERRRRLEQLSSVDESVQAIVDEADRLDGTEDGELENTYIAFASDNGFFRGEHRFATGKYLPYEPASHVPLLIRGPGIPEGADSDELVSNADITETFLDVAGSEDPSLDGRSLIPYAEDPSLTTTRPLLLEGDTGPGLGPGGFVDEATADTGLSAMRGAPDLDQEVMGKTAVVQTRHAPAFRAIRTGRYVYVLYANGETELYDTQNDPAQLVNQVRNPRFAEVRQWLFDRLIPLASCDGAECREEIGADPAPLSKSQARRRASKRH